MFEVRYSDRPQDRRLSREAALAEVKGLAQSGDIDAVQVRTDESGVFIAIFSPPERNYDDWVTVESPEFVSQDTALDFLREAELLDKLET